MKGNFCLLVVMSGTFQQMLLSATYFFPVVLVLWIWLRKNGLASSLTFNASRPHFAAVRVRMYSSIFYLLIFLTMPNQLLWVESSAESKFFIRSWDFFTWHVEQLKGNLRPYCCKYQGVLSKQILTNAEWFQRILTRCLDPPCLLRNYCTWCLSPPSVVQQSFGVVVCRHIAFNKLGMVEVLFCRS